ncbi:hypothetical protein GPAL_2866 [Glaciecola pallidula DSM 14239 = ACAM 615]|uniref:Uncharacterized protein n=1 Tax=Brumicola pallidula DSM 14239 = ACAM 615 TaxID=1121922 RepID=K6ZH73_9ALTE|nr:hypothetical protein GPAL_2866 [Glaciecola pallidula DSM 14239 = ACAM 615]
MDAPPGNRRAQTPNDNIKYINLDKQNCKKLLAIPSLLY